MVVVWCDNISKWNCFVPFYRSHSLRCSFKHIHTQTICSLKSFHTRAFNQQRTWTPNTYFGFIVKRTKGGDPRETEKDGEMIEWIRNVLMLRAEAQAMWINQMLRCSFWCDCVIFSSHLIKKEIELELRDWMRKVLWKLENVNRFLLQQWISSFSFHYGVTLLGQLFTSHHTFRLILFRFIHIQQCRHAQNRNVFSLFVQKINFNQRDWRKWWVKCIKDVQGANDEK